MRRPARVRYAAALLAPLALLPGAAPLAAQGPDARLLTAALGIPAGTTVRAATEGAHVTGRLSGVERDTLVLAGPAGDAVRVPPCGCRSPRRIPSGSGGPPRAAGR